MCVYKVEKGRPSCPLNPDCMQRGCTPQLLLSPLHVGLCSLACFLSAFPCSSHFFRFLAAGGTENVHLKSELELTETAFAVRTRSVNAF